MTPPAADGSKQPASRPVPLLGPRYRGATIGSFALIFLAAFEVLAVTTVMPTVTDALDGRAWYSVAFSAPLGASVLGIVAAGLWADRVGGVRPLMAAVGLFSVGLLVSGVAPDIAVFLLGRIIHGIGGGGLTVSLYVLVGQVYDEIDRPRLFGAFALAWVLPGLIGPFLAGIIADTVGWRWVFLGVIALVAGALSLLAPYLASVDRPPNERGAVGVRDVHRLLLAAAVAACVIALNLATGLSGWRQAAVAILAVAAAAVASRPLLPTGTLTAAPGLAAVISYRAVIGAAFFAAEAYVPFVLQEQYDVSVWLSGLTLSGATIGWAIASHLQGRLGTGLPDEKAFRIGSQLLVGGISVLVLGTVMGLPPAVLGAAWFLSSTGMGFSFPRTSTATLSRSTPAERGTATSALTLGDTVGGAVGLGVAGLAFAVAGTAEDRGAFVAVFGFSLGLAALAVLVARRA